MLSKRREVVPPKSLEIKQDDKFFTRIMSKETSMANSSCRIYYGGASGAIPFMWELRPGTPKHTLANTSINPPLTPPPSYYSTLKSKSMYKRSLKQSIMSTIFHGKKKTHVSPSSSMSSTTTSSSSSSLSSFYYSSSSTFKNSKFRNRSFFSCSRSPIHYTINGDEQEDGDDGDDDNDKDNKRNIKSPTSTLRYGGRGKGLNVFGGCYLMENMKTAFLSIVGHGSG
ncbi:hypothetical protein P3X46_025823 [Hevea brasiliensis]|uniref:Uncharacterized protein n=1 Tax=Hevea brasiliensis TaxID=3981 RepID=A0ABQ9L6S2_HEVBR|nr:uncharacterized protein LOC110645828 [Hevea brasiliensis]KAJ9160419.1 hypothetical protein P3X46_025823 [Hevea brasiliensis]